MSKEGANNGLRRAGILQDWNEFCRFIEAHYATIYTVALAHCRDIDVAQEITQDVCVRLLLERAKLSQIPNPGGWLVLVARNTAIDWGRRRQRHSRILAMMETWKHDTTKTGTTPEDARTAASKREEHQRLHAALDRIAPEDREIILMHYMEGMEKQEIARLLSLHPSSVGRRMDKALRKLRASLADTELQSLEHLRHPDHNSRSIVITLAAVAALTSAQKSALAAAATPLPVLSATVATGGSAFFGKISTLVIDSVRRLPYRFIPGWAFSLGIAGSVIFMSMVVANKYWHDDRDLSSSEQLTLSTRDSNSIDAANPRKTSPRAGGNRVMNSLTSTGAFSPGKLYPSLDGKTLYGNVRNEAGEAIPGAKVTLTTYDEKTKSDTSQTVTSNAKGEFVFRDIPNDLPKGMVSSIGLTAEAKGYAHATIGEYKAWRPLPLVNEAVEIVLRPPATQHGVVINDAKEPISNAKVAVVYEYNQFQQMYQDSDFHGDIFVTHTDAQGRYTFDALKPGYVSLEIKHPDYGHLITDPIRSDDKGVEINLNKGVALVGTVHDGQTTVANAQVQIEGMFNGIRSDYFDTCQTDENGRFHIEHLSVPDPKMDSWTYSVKVTLPEEKGRLIYNVQLQPGNTSLTLAMNTMDPTVRQVSPVVWRGYYTERVTTGTPKSREGLASVTASFLGNDTLPVQRYSATLSDRQGIYISDKWSDNDQNLTFTDVPPGEYMLSYNLKTASGSYNMEPVLVKLVANDRQEIAFQHNGTSAVHGKFTGRPGRTTATITVSRENENPGWISGLQRTVASTVSAPDSSFSIEGLSAGTYMLDASGVSGVQKQAFTCAAGESVRCDLTEIKGFTVKGSLFDSSTSSPVVRGLIRVTRAFEPLDRTQQANAASDSSGNFEVRLTTGTYKLNITAFRQAWTYNATIDVKDDTTLPPIDLNRPRGGILLHAQGDLSKFSWKQAWVELYRKDDGAGTVRSEPSHTWLALDDDTQMLSGVEAGNYSAVVRYDHDIDTRVPSPFATVYIPSIEVVPDQYTIQYLPLEAAPFVEFSFKAGNEIQSWNNPRFWLKDSNGMKMPLKFKYSVLSLGLAPGEYTFGVTFDSDQEQSTVFRVSSLDMKKEIRLDLK